MLNKIKCKLGHHKYKTVKALSCQTDLIQCERCEKQYAMNYSVRCILPYDRDTQKFYDTLNNLMKLPNRK